MTLTHSCNTPWADNWLVDTGDEPALHHGLSSFGKIVLEEMNCLGMIMDLAHVSVETMKVALNLSKAPMIFRHSSAYSLCPHRHNMLNDEPRMVVSARAQPQAGRGTQGSKQDSGLPLPQGSTSSLVMVNFYKAYVTCGETATLKDVAGEAGARVGGVSVPPLPAHPVPLAPTDHMDHVKKVAGAQSVGFGGDYDGVS
ncbi:DPEP1 Dipeptidase, partial [Eolophus roseicapillus]|nr:DPEP1 Dipeptidase [Eolophus roseicapilla]